MHTPRLFSSASQFQKPTPMMQQYLTIKAQYSEYLLLYRMGDFYEMFFEDAVLASKALSITLTKRGKHHGIDIPMCGVPCHSCEGYLHKLIEQGHKVALCEQIEDPAQSKARGSKSVVKRAVTRILTPGTLTEDNLLNPTCANYLVSFATYQNQLAIAYIDISTGLFRTLETSENRMLTDINQLNPKELLISQRLNEESSKLLNNLNFFNNIINYQSEVSFSIYEAAYRIKNYYNLIDEKPLGEFCKAELCAISAIIAYIEKTQINNLPTLNLPSKICNNDFLYIDAATQQNLELFKTLSGSKKGSLLHSIDHSVTSGGARMLADRLMAPLKNSARINERLESVNFFVQNTEICNAIRDTLKNCFDAERSLVRLMSGRGSPRDLGAIQNILDIGESLKNIVKGIIFPLELSNALGKFAAIPEKVKNMLDNALICELPIHKEDGNFIAENYCDELDKARNIQKEAKNLIEQLQKNYIDKTQIKNLKIKHNNILGYFIEITALQAKQLESIEINNAPKFIHRQSLANNMRFTTTELKQTEYNIVNANSKALEIELQIFKDLSNLILQYTNEIRDISNSLSVFDVSCALARLARENNYCRPIITNDLQFNIENGRHPVVESSLKSCGAANFIANNCNLSPKDKNSSQGGFWLLTGPNMGGKSTFLRQNALLAIMAQMGSFVPATKAHIGVVDSVFSRVGASDDLSRGHSTFMVEMVETATILNQATPHSFVILDEIGRGTATYDGLSIAQAAAEYLHNNNKCRAIFATHFHELVALENELENLSNHTIKILEYKGDLVFLHEVIKGSSDRSYGIQVAKLSGLPSQVIYRAQQILQSLEQKAPSEPCKTNAHDDTNIELQRLKEEIEQIDVNHLTPMQALEAIYQLSSIIKK